MTESTFLTVERLGDDEVWIPVATDADWETKYVYQIALLRTTILTYLHIDIIRQMLEYEMQFFLLTSSYGSFFTFHSVINHNGTYAGF